MKQNYTGTLITIEGIDGSGKSSLANFLAAQLEKRGLFVRLTKEPGGTTLGSSLRTILQTQKVPTSKDYGSLKVKVCDTAEFLMFAADRAQHFYEVIVPALKDNYIVISDRMADSSLAYQGYGRGLDGTMIERVNAWAMQNITPSLTIFLEIDPVKALGRVHGRNEQLTAFEQERLDFWTRVADGYEKIFATRDNVITLDATMSEQTLGERALHEILERFGK